MKKKIYIYIWLRWRTRIAWESSYRWQKWESKTNKKWANVETEYMSDTFFSHSFHSSLCGHEGGVERGGGNEREVLKI